ncbi:hypothetical protein N431DRAFT_430066, partial [Stipitochalara longipes BDJ]
MFDLHEKGLQSFFATQKGYMGAGAQSLRAGDKVYVLYGCDVPVVLRAVGDQYIHVGPCFVQGLMDGEAFDWVEEGKATVQDIEL